MFQSKVFVHEIKSEEIGLGGKINKEGPGILLFYMPTCPHCHAVVPTLEELGQVNYEVSKPNEPGFWVGGLSIDTEGSQRVSNTHQVRSFPTFLAVDKDGNTYKFPEDVKRQPLELAIALQKVLKNPPKIKIGGFSDTDLKVMKKQTKKQEWVNWLNEFMQ